MKSPVGVIGLGIMGSAMSASLRRARYPVVGYDVLEKRRRAHRRAGGICGSSAAGVGERADVVVCSLPSSEALLQIAKELAELERPPAVVVETSTLPIAVKEQARRILATTRAILLDCPLSGTGVQARTRDLVVYASGERKAYRRVVPVFEAIARAHYFVGPFGAGSKMKFVANLLVAVHNVAAAEAMVLAMNAGLDPGQVVRLIADGAGSSRMFQVRAPMMAKGDYRRAMMKLEVWRKDMTVIADFARDLRCPTPLFSATAPIYAAATRIGSGLDTAAVCAVLEHLAASRRRSEVRRAKHKASRK